MKKNQVFISYKRENLSIAEQFHLELEKHNIKNWFDREMLPKVVSEDFIKLIHERISDSDLVLLLYSEDVNNSDFIIEHEIGYAVKNNIPIFCFMLDNSEMDSRLKEFIGKKQWICNFQDLSHMTSGYLLETVRDESRRNFLKSLIDDSIKPSELGYNYNDINLFLMRIAIQRHLGIPTTFGTYKQLEQSSDQYSEEELTINIVKHAMFWDIPENKSDTLKNLKFIPEEGVASSDWEVRNFIELCDKKYLKRMLFDFIHEKYPEILNVNEYLEQTAKETADEFIHDIRTGGKRFNGLMLGIFDIKVNRTPNDERHLLSLDMYVSDYFTFKFTVRLYHKLRTISNHFEISNTSQISQFAPFLCSLGMGGFVIIEQNGRENLLWTKRDPTISSGNMWHFSFDETVNLQKDAIRDSYGHLCYFDDKLRINPYNNFYRGLKEELGFTKSMIDIKDGGIIEVGIITSDRLEIELLAYVRYKVSSEKSIEEQLFPITESASDGKYETSKIKYIPLEKCESEFIGHLVTPEAFALYQRLYERNKLEREGNSQELINSIHIEKNASIGRNVTIDPFVYISSGCRIGDNCKIHQHVFLDENVIIGNNVKIQNHNNLYHGLFIDDGVFIGPNVTFTNDKHPRAINFEGKLKTSNDWVCSETKVNYGASLGAGSVIVCGITIGKWAMVGAGAVVTKDVPERALVVGNPAVIKGWVSDSGFNLKFICFRDNYAVMYSEEENKEYKIPFNEYVKLDNYFNEF